MKDKCFHQILHHDLGSGIDSATRLSSMSEASRKMIVNYYSVMQLPNMKPNLLFVDQWASCRTLSINALKGMFDMIIYHDTEPAGSEYMSYDLLNTKEFTKYTLKSSNAWTSLLVRTDKGIGLLNEIILPYIAEYKVSNNELYMELTHE
jgi:hypothetical protein